MECRPMKMNPCKITSRPENGWYVCGMMMQNGCWDYETMKMKNVECNQKWNNMPVFNMCPVSKKDYNCEGKCCIPLCCEQEEWRSQNKYIPNNMITMLEIPTDMKNNECQMRNMVMFLSM